MSTASAITVSRPVGDSKTAESLLRALLMGYSIPSFSQMFRLFSVAGDAWRKSISTTHIIIMLVHRAPTAPLYDVDPAAEGPQAQQDVTDHIQRQGFVVAFSASVGHIASWSISKHSTTPMGRAWPVDARVGRWCPTVRVHFYTQD